MFIIELEIIYMMCKLELFFYMEKKLKSNSNQKEDPLPYVTEKLKSSACLNKVNISFSFLPKWLPLYSQLNPSSPWAGIRDLQAYAQSIE